MDSTRARWFFAAMLIAALFSLAGCQSKERADSAVDDLVGALQEGNWDRMQVIADASLVTNLNQAGFMQMSAAMKHLGKFKERTMKSINVSDNTTEGTYTLDFEGGEVTLKLQMADDRITAFDFQGAAITDAMKKVTAGTPPLGSKL